MRNTNKKSRSFERRPRSSPTTCAPRDLRCSALARAPRRGAARQDAAPHLPSLAPGSRCTCSLNSGPPARSTLSVAVLRTDTKPASVLDVHRLLAQGEGTAVPAVARTNRAFGCGRRLRETALAATDTKPGYVLAPPPPCFQSLSCCHSRTVAPVGAMKARRSASAETARPCSTQTPQQPLAKGRLRGYVRQLRSALPRPSYVGAARRSAPRVSNQQRPTQHPCQMPTRHRNTQRLSGFETQTRSALAQVRL